MKVAKAVKSCKRSTKQSAQDFANSVTVATLKLEEEACK